MVKNVDIEEHVCDNGHEMELTTDAHNQQCTEKNKLHLTTKTKCKAKDTVVTIKCKKCKEEITLE